MPRRIPENIKSKRHKDLPDRKEAHFGRSINHDHDKMEKLSEALDKEMYDPRKVDHDGLSTVNMINDDN